MTPSNPERVVRFIVEVRERSGTTLLTDATQLRGVVVDMIKIEDMDAAVTVAHALVDEPLNHTRNPQREISLPAFPVIPLSTQLNRLANYAVRHHEG